MADTRVTIEQTDRIDRRLGLSGGEIQELSKREMDDAEGGRGRTIIGGFKTMSGMDSETESLSHDQRGIEIAT